MKMLSISLIMFTAMTAASSMSLITVWASLEINSISFTYLLSFYNNLKTPISYIMIQFFGSMLLIAGAISEHSEVTLSPYPGEAMPMDITSNLIFLAMMIKMGAVPFHKWIISVGKSMKWNPLILFLTIQKFAPLMIMSKKSEFMIQIVIIMSAYTGVMMMMSSMDMKMILNASSISHSGWMMAASLISTKTLIMYFILYSSMTILMVAYFSNNFNNSKLWCNNPKNDNQLIMILTSMAGVPPSMGFSMKMSVILLAMSNSLILTSTVMILSSLLSLYVYMTMSTKFLMKMKVSETLPNNQNKKLWINASTSVTMMTIPFILIMTASL